MERIRIKNLRSLVDTDYVELKPLTVLVGKNSSGKSTFLRFFPLIRQTIETQTNEPILWYSPRYVDFGSFEESLNKEKNCKIMKFEFEFKSSYRDMISKIYLQNSKNTYDIMKDLGIYDEFYKILLKIELNKRNFTEIEINYEDHKILIKMESNNICRIIINEIEVNKEILIVENNISKNLIPKRLSIKKINNTNDIEKPLELMEIYHSLEYIFTNYILEEFDKYSNSDKNMGEIRFFIDNIFFGSSDTILESMKIQDIKNKEFKNYIDNMTTSSDEYIKFKNLFILKNINSLLEVCNRNLELNFSNVKYIAPTRAHAERYYRVQGLSVDEIDPRGENIAMILHNMKGNELKEFNGWLIENMGFSIDSDQEGGHISIKIKGLNNNHTVNLADSGFGYSQVLPILLTLWTISNRNIFKIKRNRLRYSITIVVEQPELHLHPSFQALVIDSFCNMVNFAQENKIDLKIILETHSETILNRIGYLIAKEKIDKDLINILIFNKLDEYKTNIKSTGYSDKGRLIDWPIGFFSAEEI